MAESERQESSGLVRLVKNGDSIIIPDDKRIAEALPTRILDLEYGYSQEALEAEAERRKPFEANAYSDGDRRHTKNCEGEWVRTRVSVVYLILEDKPSQN